MKVGNIAIGLSVLFFSVLSMADNSDCINKKSLMQPERNYIGVWNNGIEVISINNSFKLGIYVDDFLTLRSSDKVSFILFDAHEAMQSESFRTIYRYKVKLKPDVLTKIVGENNILHNSSLSVPETQNNFPTTIHSFRFPNSMVNFSLLVQDWNTEHSNSLTLRFVPAGTTEAGSDNGYSLEVVPGIQWEPVCL